MCGLLSVNDLPETVDIIKNINRGYFEIKMFKLEKGEVNAGSRNIPLLRSFDLFCEGRDVGYLLCIAGFIAYFLFVSHSRNQHGAMIPYGKSVLLKFSHLLEVEKSIYGRQIDKTNVQL